MRVLVTGASGFVGSAVLKCLAKDHEPIALDARRGHAAAHWIVGDLSDPEVLGAAADLRPDAVIHLATIPGAAAEADPAIAWRVNVDATRRLVDRLAANRPELRVVFASSVAALGRVADTVDDATPLRPRLLYGAHKQIVETWLATLARRGDIGAVSLRLPGIVARPPAPSGLKSAFMSDVFHAARAGTPFVSPVGRDATMWLMSVSRAAANLVHALDAPLGEPFAFTLPALRCTMSALVAELVQQTGRDPHYVSYEPVPALEDDFGRYPALNAARARSLGFADDGDLKGLVASSLGTIEEST